MLELDPTRPASPDRRRLLVLGVGAFVAATVPAAWRRKNVLVRRQVPLMGTLAEIVVVDSDRSHAHGAIDAALTELHHVENAMSRFKAASDVGRANATASVAPVDISEATAMVLKESLRWASASEGRFDPCYGRAVELWDVSNRREPPAAEQVRRLAGRQFFRSLELDTFRRRPVVRFADEDAAIDLGGIAKGYGVDRAVSALRDSGIHHALINVGGDLYGLGESENGDPWRVGIRSAADPSTIDEMFELTDAAVATSGDYLRFFSHGGQRYHHLLDPVTGMPHVGRMHSVTVTAHTCMCADAAATTLFGMEGSSAERLLSMVAPDAVVVSKILG